MTEEKYETVTPSEALRRSFDRVSNDYCIDSPDDKRMLDRAVAQLGDNRYLLVAFATLPGFITIWRPRKEINLIKDSQ